jgi:UDP-N-acetylglucosamine--N-acetylmuramyl-(pentapeptide) pyrophosphoryl-undecaprenol N-acetylglucosamine transferase
MTMGSRPVMILAGGTGGHVYPGLEVARRLIKMKVPVVWMGTRKGLEARLVPKAGIPMSWLKIEGLRGKGIFAWLFAPLRLNIAITQAFRIMLHHRPCAVLGMGGFVAGPGGLVAFLLSRPLIIHEQNALAGLTNRLLVPLCDRILEGFPDTFKSSSKAIYTGNPVRQEIAELPAPEERLAGRQGPLHLLVLGGSLGAKALNDIVPEALSLIANSERPEVWHQAGQRHLGETQKRYRQYELDMRVEAFIDDMAAAYTWADLVLCRAGALTVAELCAVGVGAILVPYPYAVDDHQTANARFIVQAGAGILVQQIDLSPRRLTSLLRQLQSDRMALLSMARAARGLARADASEVVARFCLDAAKRHARNRKVGNAA